MDLDEYNERWHRAAAAGAAVHGEADLVDGLSSAPGRRVLDAGCGTGRVAIELARRGWQPVGVDADADMIAYARRNAPELPWAVADLAEVRLDEPVDVVVMAGDVLAFVVPGREAAAVANLARQLRPGGVLVTGGQVPDGSWLDAYDGWCANAGLSFDRRYATWEQSPFIEGATYAVSLHVATH
ncbi:MAG: class I SAM-dependent methyltransferase [Actinomycetota bacterium]